MTILIVDDEIPMRDTLRDLFQDEGFSVEVASNGREALDLLSSIHGVCALILDLVMPVMDGHQLLASMRADPRFAAIPVVIVTSDTTRAPSGVLTFRKPLKLDNVLATVSKLCREK